MEFSDALKRVMDIGGNKLRIVNFLTPILELNEAQFNKKFKNGIVSLKLTAELPVNLEYMLSIEKQNLQKYTDVLKAEMEAYFQLINHFESMVINVEAMRTAQKQYFNTGTHQALKRSVSIEKKVDAHIHYLLKSGLPINQLNDEP